MTEAVGILNGPARRLNPCTNAEILYLLQCTRAIGKHHANDGRTDLNKNADVSHINFQRQFVRR